MTRTVLFGVALLIAAVCEAQTCLHGPDESREEQARRAAAVRFVQRVNAAERALREKDGRFDNLFNLTAVDAPPVGFVPRLTFDSWSYTIVAKDTFDPCQFSLFSDQEGVIYEGRPVAGSASGGRLADPMVRSANPPEFRHWKLYAPHQTDPLSSRLVGYFPSCSRPCHADGALVQGKDYCSPRLQPDHHSHD